MKNINKYSSYLVSEFSKFEDEQYQLSVDDLPEHEQCELARLFLEHNKRDTSECFSVSGQSPLDDDITCSLLKVLTQNSQDNRNQLVDLIVNNTFNIFKKRMQKVIDDYCAIRTHEEIYEHGHSTYINPKTGETEYRSTYV